MSVNNNSSRTIDGQNTLFCDTIEITEEIILNGDNGAPNNIIRSDGVNARWAVISDLMLDLTAGTNISYNAGNTYNGGTARTISATNTEYTAGTGLTLSVGNEFSTNNIPNSDLANSTISGKSLGTNLDNLTAGTNISYSAGSTYNGGSAITINSTDTNTEYTAGTGLTLSVGNEFSTNNIPNSDLANSTISGKSLGTNLESLTAGTNIVMASLDGIEPSYNGNKAITIASTDTNTEYTAGTGLTLTAEEFSLTPNPSTTKFFPIVQTGNNGLETGQLYYDTVFGLTIA
tara:strand:+ start:8363 stop:9229 length:867 start_codon:yes stop_codon:yes gene_type:complete